MSDAIDPDLPGDEAFTPVRSGAVVFPDGRMALVDAIKVEDQARIHHNRLRYIELGKARRGEANRYAASRYR